MKIADLFASVHLDIEQASLRKTENAVEQFQRRTQRHLDNLQPPTMKIARFGDTASRAFTKVASAAARVGKIGALAVGAGIAVAAKDALNFDAILTDIDISSGSAVGNINELRKKMLEVSTATGLAKEQVAAGAQAFITLTGDAKTATKSMDLFARVAMGQKADMGDVATVAATLGQQFGILAPQFEQAFSILSAGAKAGAVEFRDMAGLMASLGARFHAFSDSQGISGIADLGAMFQVAKRGFGTASEAAAGLERLMAGVQRINKAKLKASGLTGQFTQYEKDGKTLKPLLQIVDELAKKDLNGTQLFALLESSEAKQTFDVISRGRKDVDHLRESLRGARDVMVDFKKRAEAPSSRAAAAWNTFKNKIAEAFTPERIEKFVMAMESVLEALAEFGAGFKYWVIDPILAAIQAIKDFAGGVKDVLNIANDALQGDIHGISASHDPLESIAAPIRAKRAAEKSGLADPTSIQGQQALMTRAQGSGPKAFLSSEGRGRFMLQGGTVSMNGTTINVTVPPGADGKAIGAAAHDEYRRRFHQFWDEQVRKAAL